MFQFIACPQNPDLSIAWLFAINMQATVVCRAQDSWLHTASKDGSERQITEETDLFPSLSLSPWLAKALSFTVEDAWKTRPHWKRQIPHSHKRGRIRKSFNYQNGLKRQGESKKKKKRYKPEKRDGGNGS